jgi:molybdenum cofactor guanylyltransferase
MGRDKALVAVDGVPMAERVARALHAAGCDVVRFIGGDASALEALGRPVVPDSYPGAGPLGAVITALRVSGRPVVVAACDLPDLDADTVVAVIGDGTGDRPRVAHTGRIEPMLAWWPLAALGAVEAQFASGERALHRALAVVGYVAVPVAAGRLRNVNTPLDLHGVADRSVGSGAAVGSVTRCPSPRSTSTTSPGASPTEPT